MKYKLWGYPEHVNQLQKQTRLSELVSVMLGGFSTKASFLQVSHHFHCPETLAHLGKDRAAAAHIMLSPRLVSRR